MFHQKFRISYQSVDRHASNWNKMMIYLPINNNCLLPVLQCDHKKQPNNNRNQMCVCVHDSSIFRPVYLISHFTYTDQSDRMERWHNMSVTIAIVFVFLLTADAGAVATLHFLAVYFCHRCSTKRFQKAIVMLHVGTNTT